MAGALSSRKDAEAAPREPSRVPKYYRLKQDLIKQLAALDLGQALPSERQLAAQYEMSRTTVRQALHELVVEGRLERVHGSGTYATPPKVAQRLHLMSFTEDMRAQGLEPSSRVVEIGTLRADDFLAEKLAIAPGGKVLRVARLRMANGEPRAIETSHLSASRFPRLRQHLLRIGSLYAALAEFYDVHLEAAEETIETVPARPEEAAILETDVGLPMLMCSRHSFDATGEPVEWVRSVYRGDRYKFVAWLRRPGGAGIDTGAPPTGAPPTAAHPTGAQPAGMARP